jgi:hypothetical protein
MYPRLQLVSSADTEPYDAATPGLDTLLGWMKVFERTQVFDQDQAGRLQPIPHGFSSLTLHDRNGKRVLGYDTHGLRHGGNFSGRPLVYDHKRSNRRAIPYVRDPATAAGRI